MKNLLFQLTVLLFLTSCSFLEKPVPEEPSDQVNIQTGRTNYLPGTHVSNTNFQYRIKKIDWISVWEDDTSTVEYFYNNDLLTKVEATLHGETYLFTYSNDTVYYGVSFSVFDEGKLISKSDLYAPERIIDCFWDGYKLVKIIRDNLEYSINYNSDGYLLGLHGSDIDFTYEYFDNRALKKIIIKSNIGEHESVNEYIYSYNDGGLVHQIYNWGEKNDVLLSVLTFEYDDRERLESLKYEAGQNIYEYRYYYESGNGNALYLYHPTYLNWPFDYYICSILQNIPTIL